MITKNIPFKDTFLTIKNYKEPLREIPTKDGFGYYGCLLVTTDGTKAQCHICGNLLANVAIHVREKHKLKAGVYNFIE